MLTITGEKLLYTFTDSKGEELGSFLYVDPTADPDRGRSGTFKVDNTKKPAHFDHTLKGTENPKIGIYKIEKDTLTICTYRGLGGEKNRPTKFEPHEDETIEYTIYVYEKVK